MKDSLEKSIMLDPQKRKCYQQAGWISEGELTEQDIQMISRILTLESLGFSDTEIKDLFTIDCSTPGLFQAKIERETRAYFGGYSSKPDQARYNRLSVSICRYPE